MDRKEHLKSMLTNLVHDRNEEATVDFHNYLQLKMQEIVNPAAEKEEEVQAEETDNTTADE
jgi:hypothetical protein